MRIFTVAIAVAISATLASGCGRKEPAPPAAGDLRSGHLSTPPTPRYPGTCEFPAGLRIIRTEAEWQETWSALFACTSCGRPAPAVDFEREMVVLGALGQRSSAGYYVSIDSAAVDGGGTLRVATTEYRPGRGCVTATVITHPLALARVPRTGAPAALAGRVEVVDCE